MAGTSTASVAFEFKSALFDAIEAAAAASDIPGEDLLCCWGYPGPHYPTEVISIVRTTSDQDTATLGASVLSREETLSATVSIVVGRAGDWRAQREAERQAYALLRMIETYLRSGDVELGGVVRQCFLRSHTCEGFTGSEQHSRGRAAEITAVFEAQARIKNV